MFLGKHGKSEKVKTLWFKGDNGHFWKIFEKFTFDNVGPLKLLLIHVFDVTVTLTSLLKERIHNHDWKARRRNCEAVELLQCSVRKVQFWAVCSS